jgi:hypothetical protein
MFVQKKIFTNKYFSIIIIIILIIIIIIITIIISVYTLRSGVAFLLRQKAKVTPLQARLWPREG